MFEEILKLLVPTVEEEEKAFEIINEFKERLEKYLPEILIGGSFGKGTWLKNQSDVDLFVLFETDDGKLSDHIEDALQKLGLNYIRIHGSRDYFKVKYKEFEFEIVPILKINKPEEAKNVTDLSPFHVNYVRRKVKENPDLVNEIRLTKAFMKAIGAYGAESYINGFSGYACEILTIYYRSFLNLIKEASRWKPKVILDPENYYKDKKEIFEKLNTHRLKSPIIIIDPVYPIRNVTASVSTKVFAKFIFYCRRFLEDLEKNNIKKYFIKERKTESYFIEKNKKLGTKLVILEVVGKGNNLDIKNTKILKFSEFIKKQLELLGFRVLDLDITFQEDLEKPGKIYLYIYPERLPDYELRFGPPSWVFEHSEKFYQKWKEYEIKISSDGRLISIVPRKVKNIKEALEFILMKFRDNIKDKIYRIDLKII